MLTLALLRVCAVLYDVRQRTVMRTLTAHRSVVKALDTAPDESHFVSGSVDGDVKVRNFLRVSVYIIPVLTARVLCCAFVCLCVGVVVRYTARDCHVAERASEADVLWHCRG